VHRATSDFRSRRSIAARYDPFVMNNKEELVQAMVDYRQSRMGIFA
jgi:redox-sensitive bicupin YhaK (pirin superfamily)